MTQMSLTGTQSDLFTDSGNPHTDLDTLPPGNGDELWQHVEVGQKDGAPAETDSDSGDSLFITQKPVAEAVRSGRRSRRSSFSPGSPSDTDAERSDDSASPEKSETDKKKTPKKVKRPKYSFSFLRQSKIVGRMCVGELKAKQNTELQNAAMGGFFKCARDMWQNYPAKEDLESALPTVDMPGESIHPISEEEEDKPEDEDIKVVEKKRFVVSLKAKSSQPWYAPNKGDGQEKLQRGRRPTDAKHEASQGGRREMMHKVLPAAPKSREILSTDSDSSEDGESVSRAPVERQTSDRSVVEAKTQKEKEDDDSDSVSEASPGNTEVCEPSPSSTEASVAEPQADVSLTDQLSQTEQAECEPESQNLTQTDANNGTECSEGKVENKNDRGDHEGVEEDKSQSQDEPEGDVGITEVEETPSRSQTIDEPEIHGKDSMEVDNMMTLEEEEDVPNANIQKKKDKLAAEDVREEEGHLESDVRVEEQDSESCITENGDEKKSDEDVDLLTSSLQSEPLNDVAEKPKKKKKTKLAVEDVREEEEGHLESDVRVEEEDSVFSDRCDAEDGGEKKSDEDVDSLKSNLQSEPLSDVAEKPKKKKKKNKLAAEYVRHEGEEGHLESDVRTEEESVFLESCDTENGGEKKSDEDIDSLKSNLHAKPLNDVAEKPKRKKKKKTKLAAEDVRQEGDEGHLELDVRVEEQDSVFSDRCDAENGGEKKSDEDVDLLKSNLQSEPLNDVAEKPKKKKKKKKKNKLAAEDVGDEEEGHLESDVRMEEQESVSLESCITGNGNVKKSDEDADLLNSSLQSEPLNDVAEKLKKKKKKKKIKLAAEDVRQEGDEGHLESDVMMEEEESVSLESCITENGSKKKSDEDVDLLNSSLQSESLINVAEKPKKKKTKRKKDLTSEPTEQLEEIKDCLENTEASQEMLESSSVKRKKKKKQKSASVDDDAPIGRDDCIDESFSKEVITESPVQKKKKKKKKEKTEDENVGGAQETTEGGEDQDAGLVGTITNNDTVTQNDDSVRKKKRTRSFLVADAEETAAQTHQETQSGAADRPAGESAETAGSWMGSDDGVRKKKKKRKKVSAEREREEKDHEPDFEEPNTCLVVETGLKRKKKRKMDEEVASVEKSERDSQTDESVGSKKKRKKKIPPTTAENNESEEATLNVSVSLSNKKKSQTVAAKGLDETCNDGSAADDRTTRETLAEHASPSPETPGNQPLNDVKGKKKRKKVKETEGVSLEAKSFPEIEAHKPKKKNRRETESSFSPVFSDTSLSQYEASSLLSVCKKSTKKAKRKLCSPSEDFFTDC